MNAERGADYGPASAGLKRIRSSSPSTFGSTELGQSKKCRIGGDDFVLQAAMGDFKRVCENELQASVRKGYKKALAVQLLIDKISGGRQTGSSSDGVEQLMAVACLERPDAERVLLVRNEVCAVACACLVVCTFGSRFSSCALGPKLCRMDKFRN
eukprot:TRINITY_DN1635_c0_g2_i1.p1 TRINITY_DN1635_c0_g2~~TRINITY_DN1635_c0_g2_i1.p1  ORF type:complete len:155 (-),score=16.44 TRINITY_DN1635_c0_g2_i1:622-1086(-)